MEGGGGRRMGRVRFYNKGGRKGEEEGEDMERQRRDETRRDEMKTKRWRCILARPPTLTSVRPTSHQVF